VPLHQVPRDSRLSDFEAELQQLAMDAGSAPERVIQAHLIDQRPELRLDLRAPSSIPRFPSPVTAKPSSMPAHQRLWPDDVKNLQYRREPAIQLDEEQAIAVGQPNPAPALPPQYDQLLPKRRILRLKPRLRSERRDQHGQNEAEVPDHPISLRDSVRTSME